MAKMHTYVGLDGAKQIWIETGKRFVDESEFAYVLDNINLSIDNVDTDQFLKLTIPIKNDEGVFEERSIMIPINQSAITAIHDDEIEKIVYETERLV